jgi:AraC-like DNA-binding protein
MNTIAIHPAFPEIYPQLCRFREMDDWTHEAMPCPFWRYYWNPTPGAWVERGGTRVDLGPEHWVLLSPGAPVRTGHDRPFEHLFLHFTLGSQLRPRREILTSGPMAREERNLLLALIESPGFSIPRELGLMALVARALASLPDESWHATVTDDRIRRALDRIHLLENEPLDTALLAEEVGMHPKSFTRLFKQQVGIPPYRYALERRLDAAAQELHHTRESVEAIAEAWGFSDRYHLTRLLAKHRGTTPGKLRATGKLSR